MTRKFKSPGELMIFFPPPPIFITPSNSNDTRVALIKISFRLETFNRVQSRPNSVEAGRRRRRRKEERKQRSFSNFQRDLFVWNFICIEARMKEGREKHFLSLHFCVQVAQRSVKEKARCNYAIFSISIRHKARLHGDWPHKFSATGRYYFPPFRLLPSAQIARIGT